MSGRSERSGQMLLPPDNFGIVEEGLYRCSKLDAINFSFLETLQLKTIVILNKESQVMKNFQNFMKMNEIESIKFNDDSIDIGVGDQNNNDWMVFPTQVIQNVFKVLLDRNSYNLLIIDKTNVIIGLLRKICKWNYSSILSEYRLFTGKNSNYFAETFLELASIQLITDIKNFRRESVDQAAVNSFKNDDADIEEEDEIDENLLSASPKIPKSLLKMVELRKRNNDKHQKSATLGELYHSDTEYQLFYRTKPQFNVESIKVTLPADFDLPGWFKDQRNMWIQENNSYSHS